MKVDMDLSEWNLFMHYAELKARKIIYIMCGTILVVFVPSAVIESRSITPAPMSCFPE